MPLARCSSSRYLPLSDVQTVDICLGFLPQVLGALLALPPRRCDLHTTSAGGADNYLADLERHSVIKDPQALRRDTAQMYDFKTSLSACALILQLTMVLRKLSSGHFLHRPCVTTRSP